MGIALRIFPPLLDFSGAKVQKNNELQSADGQGGGQG